MGHSDKDHMYVNMTSATTVTFASHRDLSRGSCDCRRVIYPQSFHDMQYELLINNSNEIFSFWKKFLYLQQLLSRCPRAVEISPPHTLPIHMRRRLP